MPQAPRPAPSLCRKCRPAGFFAQMHYTIMDPMVSHPIGRISCIFEAIINVLLKDTSMPRLGPEPTLSSMAFNSLISSIRKWNFQEVPRRRPQMHLAHNETSGLRAGVISLVDQTFVANIWQVLFYMNIRPRLTQRPQPLLSSSWRPFKSLTEETLEIIWKWPCPLWGEIRGLEYSHVPTVCSLTPLGPTVCYIPVTFSSELTNCSKPFNSTDCVW